MCRSVGVLMRRYFALLWCVLLICVVFFVFGVYCFVLISSICLIFAVLCCVIFAFVLWCVLACCYVWCRCDVLCCGVSFIALRIWCVVGCRRVLYVYCCILRCVASRCYFVSLVLRLSFSLRLCSGFLLLSCFIILFSVPSSCSSFCRVPFLRFLVSSFLLPLFSYYVCVGHDSFVIRLAFNLCHIFFYGVFLVCVVTCLTCFFLVYCVLLCVGVCLHVYCVLCSVLFTITIFVGVMLGLHCVALRIRALFCYATVFFDIFCLFYVVCLLHCGCFIYTYDNVRQTILHPIIPYATRPNTLYTTSNEP